jgi:hypothetical protein
MRIRIAGAALLVLLGVGLLTRITDHAGAPPKPERVPAEIRAIVRRRSPRGVLYNAIFLLSKHQWKKSSFSLLTGFLEGPKSAPCAAQPNRGPWFARQAPYRSVRRAPQRTPTNRTREKGLSPLGIPMTGGARMSG